MLKNNFISKVLAFLTFLVFLSACEKEIPINFPQEDKQLVVEGWIEQGKGPKILLSFSAPYFSDIDSSSIMDYAALRAKITISYDGDSTILTLRPNNIYFPPYYYAGEDIEGILGNTYNLKIEYSGKIYTASTTIPQLVIPDSLWFEKVPGSDSLGLLWIRIDDRADQENYYRTLVKRKGIDTRFIPTFISVYDDKLFNGEKFTMSLSRGNKNMLEVNENHYFKVGDTLIFEFCSMGKPVYDFWHSIQNSILTSANPFSANVSSVESNISNGLGVWGGYASYYDTIIAK
jgi:hypothetical protein